MAESTATKLENTLSEGDAAPLFNLPADGDTTINLADLKGKQVVLYFYPKDDTPGCTTEGKEFSAQHDAFDAIDTIIIGASKDSVKKHDAFKAKHDLTIPLVSDEEGTLCEAYGTWIQKSMYGRKYMGIDRATFLIDRDGVIQQIWRKVPVKKHVETVLKAAQELAAESK